MKFHLYELNEIINLNLSFIILVIDKNAILILEQ